MIAHLARHQARLRGWEASKAVSRADTYRHTADTEEKRSDPRLLLTFITREHAGRARPSLPRSASARGAVTSAAAPRRPPSPRVPGGAARRLRRHGEGKPSPAFHRRPRAGSRAEAAKFQSAGCERRKRKTRAGGGGRGCCRPPRPAARQPSEWGSAQGAACGEEGEGTAARRLSPAQWPPAPPSLPSLSLPSPVSERRIPSQPAHPRGPGLPYLQRHLLRSPVGPQAAQQLQGALAAAGPLPLADGDVQLRHLRGAGRDVDVVGHGGGRERQGRTGRSGVSSAVEPATEGEISTWALDKAAPPPPAVARSSLGERAGGQAGGACGALPSAAPHLPACGRLPPQRPPSPRGCADGRLRAGGRLRPSGAWRNAAEARVSPQPVERLIAIGLRVTHLG